ncbi:hypothetical protein ACHAWF_010428 [Thalassiosira exigua]
MTTSPHHVDMDVIVPQATFALLASVKWLLVPTYRSTDFDVHRNWLAVTRNLPLSEWYFDDAGGTTVHTLDYPPAFAFFEGLLSNNGIAERLLESGWLDGRCLELLPDADNEPSDRCVRFQRATVILSDAVLFWGAYLAAVAVARSRGDGRGPLPTFLLIVTNPGLIMLDHVHFQYNGMLLGLLLMSIAFMVLGSMHPVEHNKMPTQRNQLWEILSAATFSLLLSMKHLYLTLLPLYFCYLLRRHCVTVKRNGNDTPVQFSWIKFLLLLGVSLLFFLGPFVPFLMQSDPLGQVRQILRRLFPFGRGLVHDYWAANVWALYLFGSKMASLVLRKAPIPASIIAVVERIVPFPEPQPSLVAVFLLVGVWPGGVHMAWKVGRWSLTKRIKPGRFFIHAIVFCSLSAFMLGYHVHEKAIMTAIIPLTLLATESRRTARLFTRLCTFGLFGLLPLLFRPDELMLKTTLFVTWMCGAIYFLERIHCYDRNERVAVVTKVDIFAFATLACVFIFMEVIHPIFFMPKGKLEFLPLMSTSVVCALGLLWCWVESFNQMRIAWK